MPLSYYSAPKSTIFHTQDYANRQYAYERDVRYRLEIPAYQGSGLRSYLLFEYKMNAKIIFWIKYGKFYYPQQDTVVLGLPKLMDLKDRA